jgi:predicted DNA-binding transcriptional regulator AlpA
MSILPESDDNLPRYHRYCDLRDAGIVKSWQQLRRMIEQWGFPAGRLLSPNVRAWTPEEINTWHASRPTERKSMPQRKECV